MNVQEQCNVYTLLSQIQGINVKGINLRENAFTRTKKHFLFRDIPQEQEHPQLDLASVTDQRSATINDYPPPQP